MGELLTKTEFAKRIGLDRSRIFALVKQGRLSTDKNGKVDFEKGKKEIEINRLDDPRRFDNKSTSDPEVQDIKKAEARIKLEIADMDLKQRRGELVEKDQVIKTCQSIVSIARTRLLTIPQKLAPQLIGIDSIKKIKSMLEKEIHQALNELSRLENYKNV